MPLRISLVHLFEQQQEETWALAFSPDGRYLVSSDGSTLYLWRLDEEGKWSYERSLPFRNATFPRFAPDGKMLAFGGQEEFVKLISVEGREVATFPSPSHADWAFSPDEHWFVSNGKGQDALLWDLVTFQRFPISISSFDHRGESTNPSSESLGPFIFTPDGRRLVFGTSSVEGYMHIGWFDPAHRRIIPQKTFPVNGMVHGAISPDGKMLAMIIINEQSFAPKQEIYVYDLDLLRLLHVFPQTTHERHCLLAFSPDSRWLASAKSEGSIDILSLETLTCETQFAAHPGLSSHATDPVGGLDWSKTGYIATGGASVFEEDMEKADYTIKIWRVEEV